MEIRDYLKNFTQKDNRLAALSYFPSFAVLGLGLYGGTQFVNAGQWLLALPFVLTVMFSITRLYVLQHDAGHHALFEKKWQNDLAGYALSVVTFTPYRAMQYNHNMHHAYIGNLEHRETTEIHTMTLREWQAATRGQRLYYRLYRNPFVLLPVGGIFTYFIAYRWPKNALKIGAGGIIAHNLMMLVWFFSLYLLGGWTTLAVLAVAVVLASIIGVFMVFLQHNFEDTYWDRKPDLDFRKATLQGSSCLDLGHFWDIATANIAYHDIHHFMPAIPCYRLRIAHHQMPQDFGLRRIGWGEALRSFRLKLWDEESERLVPFPKLSDKAVVAAE